MCAWGEDCGGRGARRRSERQRQRDRQRDRVRECGVCLETEVYLITLTRELCWGAGLTR